MKKAVWFCAVAAALVLSGAAHAADLRPITKAPALAPAKPIYNWTGFYIGGHAGAAWADHKFHDVVGAIDVAEFRAQGYLGGGQIGYNWQTGSWVFGAELEGSFAHLRRGVGFGRGFGGLGGCFTQFGINSCGFGGGFGSQFGGQFGAQVEALGLLSGRLGYAWDRTLLYVKGGGALAREKYIFRIPSATLSLTPTDTRYGWFVGAGVEYALTTNWTIKVEYNYIDFGTERLAPASAGVGFLFDQSQQVQLVKGGFNYKF